VAGLALLGFRAASAQETLVSARDLAGGRLEFHKIPSAPPRTVAIWLPPGYEDSAQRYPVAYLLHGQGRNSNDFTNTGGADAPGNVARLVDEGRIELMILVMPNR
jgi:enterochelin esterase-like enzyme